MVAERFHQEWRDAQEVWKSEDLVMTGEVLLEKNATTDETPETPGREITEKTGEKMTQTGKDTKDPEMKADPTDTSLEEDTVMKMTCADVPRHIVGTLDPNLGTRVEREDQSDSRREDHHQTDLLPEDHHQSGVFREDHLQMKMAWLVNPNCRDARHLVCPTVIGPQKRTMTRKKSCHTKTDFWVWLHQSS